MKTARLRRIPALACLGALLSACAGEPDQPPPTGGGGRVVWSFDRDETGAPPGGFTPEVGEWQVVADASAPSPGNVLAQLARNERPVFNVALASGAEYGDVDVAVELKSIAGEIDQGGGVVWRAADDQNYYIARYNPLEDNYRVYKVEKGRRRQLQSADLERSGGWHTLRVTMKGDHIECYYDGRKHLDVKDATFKGPGRIGLWTKADAQTYFDDLTVTVP
jgi:hypothetical protein